MTSRLLWSNRSVFKDLCAVSGSNPQAQIIGVGEKSPNKQPSFTSSAVGLPSRQRLRFFFWLEISDMNNFYNAIPRLSHEARAKDLAYELRVSNSFCAALVRLNPTVLSNALRGIKNLPNEVGQELVGTLMYLLQIAEASRPWTIPMENAVETRELINRLRKANVTPEKIRAAVANLMDGTL